MSPIPEQQEMPGGIIRLGEESGQTAQERQDLRTQLRQLKLKIDTKKEAMEDAMRPDFNQIRREENELFDQIRYPREMVLDGENVELISDRFVKQIDHVVKVCT